MKKRLWSMICLICLLASLMACGNDLPAETDPPETTLPTETQTPTETTAPDPIELSLDENTPPEATGSDTSPLSEFEGRGKAVVTQSGEIIEGSWRFTLEQNGVASSAILPEAETAYTAQFIADSNPEQYAALTAEIIPTVVPSAPDFKQPTVADLNDLIAGNLSLMDLGLNKGTIYADGSIQWVDENGQEADLTAPIEKNKVYTWRLTAEDGRVWEDSVTIWPSMMIGESTFCNISYKLYVPEGYDPGNAAPMYVYLHGCNAFIEAVGTQAGLESFAEENDCLVLMPQQSEINNASLCWNWFELSPATSGNLTRFGGEPEQIVSIINEVRGYCAVDADRIFVGGASAGAYMSNILAVTYPDVFSGVMLNSGGAYWSQRIPSDAFMQMALGVEWVSKLSFSELAEDALTQMGDFARVVPMVIVQGTADTTVASQNGLDAARCWAEVLHSIDENISTEPVMTESDTYTLYTYYNEADNTPVIQLYMVDGMEHVYATGEDGTPDILQISFDHFMK